MSVKASKPCYPRVYYTFTFRCNLHCRKCVNLSSYQSPPWNASTEEVKQVLDRLFEIADFDIFDFCGGELFLRKDLAEIMRYAHRYDGQVHDFWCIVTNCGFPFSDEMLDIVKQYGRKLKIKLDDYGTLSPHFQDNYDALTGIGAWTEVHTYHGDNQYFGGWIDRALSPVPLWTPEDGEKMWKRCQGSRQSKIDVVGDLVSYCTAESLLRSTYGVTDIAPTGSFSLFDTSLTIEDMRLRIEKILSCDIVHSPCRYHSEPFSDSVTDRIPAAQQMTREEIRTIHSGTATNEELYKILTKKG